MVKDLWKHDDLSVALAGESNMSAPCTAPTWMVNILLERHADISAQRGGFYGNLPRKRVGSTVIITDRKRSGHVYKRQPLWRRLRPTVVRFLLGKGF